jgi:hypothetical protein
VLTSNELAGFKTAGVSVYKTPSSWISAEQVQTNLATAEKAMLSRDGFRLGVRENLMSGGTSGLSAFEQFRSPAAARNALAFYVPWFKELGYVGAPTHHSRSPGSQAPWVLVRRCAWRRDQYRL